MGEFIVSSWKGYSIGSDMQSHNYYILSQSVKILALECGGVIVSFREIFTI